MWTWNKYVSDIQGLKQIYPHAPVFKKLLVDVFHQKQGKDVVPGNSSSTQDSDEGKSQGDWREGPEKTLSSFSM